MCMCLSLSVCVCAYVCVYVCVCVCACVCVLCSERVLAVVDNVRAVQCVSCVNDMLRSCVSFQTKLAS